MPDALTTTDLPFPKTSGKVRDVYDISSVLKDHLLIVATDRVSAFDVVMPTPIPGKGVLLTQMAVFWFQQLLPLTHNHLVTAEVGQFPEALQEYAAVLEGRSMLVRRLEIVPFECVARGYLAGSGLKEYQATGRVCGIELPPGLRDGDKLPEPIFTPATKAATGHDENVSFEMMADALGAELTTQLRDLTLSLYRHAADYAAGRGILIADTKFEFGRDAFNHLVLADEALTPDSSRFWPADTWQPGGPQASFDKQFVRDHLAGLDWNQQPPGPALPQHVIDGTLARYREALTRLTK